MQRDNARLTRLLVKTGQFKDFFEYNRDTGAIVFVGDVDGNEEHHTTFGSPVSDIMTRHNVSILKYEKSTGRGAGMDEWRHWVPQDAYDLAVVSCTDDVTNV